VSKLHLRQAIETKYLGPTNSRGSRIKASCAAGSITVSYDHAKDIAENHEAALCALRLKLDWCKYSFSGGVLKDGTYAWVITGGLK